jgi:predicted nuclease of predicted toxin-antitoxin system
VKLLFDENVSPKLPQMLANELSAVWQPLAAREGA